MNKVTSSLFSFRALLLTIGSLILVITHVWLPVSGTTQTQDRTVTKFRKLAMPVEVKAVKTKKGSFKLGQAISDDDDWFDGLAISIENVSGKTIIYRRWILISQVARDRRCQTSEIPTVCIWAAPKRPQRRKLD